MVIQFGGNVNDRCGNLTKKKQNSNQLTQSITWWQFRELFDQGGINDTFKWEN